MSFIAARHGLKKREEIPDDFPRSSFETPPEFFRWLNAKLDFQIDLAATKENALCPEFYTSLDNTLSRPWRSGVWGYLNPPFDVCRAWIKKVQLETEAGCKTAVLCNADTVYTAYYNERPAEQEFKIVGRMSFCANGIPVKGNASNQTLLLFNKRMKKKNGVLYLEDIFKGTAKL